MMCFRLMTEKFYGMDNGIECNFMLCGTYTAYIKNYILKMLGRAKKYHA